VADTGIGIPQAEQERIFERFYRVDAARSREAGGTGLGLSIARHIVEAHDGRLWVESAVGEGSHFHFSIPVA
jgi:two-component system phosphate regulon sensor histidine kinase PhoR